MVGYSPHEDSTRMSAWQLFLRRRRFVVKRRLQARLLLASVIHVTIVCGVIAAVLFGPVILALMGGDPLTQPVVRAADQLLYLHHQFWPAVALVVVLVALHSIRVSHTIAGPLKRFERALEEIETGRLPDPIRLRHDDLLHEEAARINRTVATVRARRAEQEARVQALRDLIGELRRADRNGSDVEWEKGLRRIEDAAAHLATDTSDHGGTAREKAA